MCGIVAVYNRSGLPVDPGMVVRMRDTLWHRGPDDEGLLVEDGVGLGHRRLSIVDLSPAGRQPMSNEDGTLWLIFNGEIYNYVELAAQLRARGHEFRSSTDSEVILHLYEDAGEDCVRQLNGMFAFVIWDRRTGTLFAARDRLGIKPLYYYEDSDWFLCASEIKALLEHPAVRAAPDWRGVADYLFAGYTLGSNTMFANVRQVPPAHCLRVDAAGPRVKEYWAPRYAYHQGRSFERVVGDLADLVDDAVRIHCRSDASLGCHLSGGMDSSLVTALASRHRDALDTFSIHFLDGEFFDESRYARRVAQHLGTTHWEDAPGSEDLTALHATLMWHQDQPTADAAGFSYFAVSRLAARHVKVALTGHGGDEIFAGYRGQFRAAFGSTAMFDDPLWRAPAPPPWATRVGRLLRSAGPLGLVRRAARRIRGARPESLGERWVRSHCGPDPRTDPRLGTRLRAEISGYSPLPAYLAPLEAGAADHPLERVLHHDLRVYLPHLLQKEDRASMAVSLESRVPLLDYRIVEFLGTVPPDQKVQGLVPKALLRAVARPVLPASIVDRRDKKPFPSPESQWIRGGRLPAVAALLAEERSLERGIFDADELRKGLLGGWELLTAFNVELWFRVFIDRDPYWLQSIVRPQAPAGADRM
jgi:asparagine synthase (glutamine-hydrolysing)